MFAVNIALGSTTWRLLFKDKDKFNAAKRQLDLAMSVDTPKVISDEFGQEMVFIPKHVIGLMFEDLDKAKMANVELFLHQQRVQAMATKAAQSDPGLRASSAMNGPRVLNPMGSFPTN